MFVSRIPVKPPELGIPNIMALAEVEKRGNAEQETKREKNAVPTPCSFDFTQVGVGRFGNGNRLVQSVTNFLKMKRGLPAAAGKP